MQPSQQIRSDRSALDHVAAVHPVDVANSGVHQHPGRWKGAIADMLGPIVSPPWIFWPWRILLWWLLPARRRSRPE
jgi:hypothetical protein